MIPKNRLKIENGTKYGMLTVIGECEYIRIPSGQINRVMLCRCDCGNIKKVRLLYLVHNRVRTCGHINERHGECFTHLYNTWRAMKRRCNPSYFQSEYYFKKGITFYSGWKRYKKFREWALNNGYIDGLQIDRIDNSKGYYPYNCRFVTQFENMNNRDKTVYVNYKNEKRSLMLILREQNKEYHYHTIHGRIERGWSADDAIDIKIRKGNYKRSAVYQKMEPL